MKTIKITIIIIISALILSLIRYSFLIHKQQDMLRHNISVKYMQMFYLCEDKYQLNAKGNINEAYKVKEQQEQLQIEINNLLNKY